MKGPKPSLTGSWPSTRRFNRDAWPEPKGRERRGRQESTTTTIDELIERLKALPKDVRRRPLMDGKPAVGYRLAPLDHISVEKVLASNDGFCGMTDPELTDAENVAEAGDRYGMSARIERRALAFFD